MYLFDFYILWFLCVFTPINHNIGVHVRLTPRPPCQANRGYFLQFFKIFYISAARVMHTKRQRRFPRDTTLRRFAYIPRQARNDGDVGFTLPLFYKAHKGVPCPYPIISTEVHTSLPPSHHFDRSERQRAKRRNQGVSRTKHSLTTMRRFAAQSTSSE